MLKMWSGMEVKTRSQNLVDVVEKLHQESQLMSEKLKVTKEY